jgi:prephenate dehydrogenase
MTVFILGLGLMGSAYAHQLFQKNETVFGWDLNEDVRAFHQEKKIVNLRPLDLKTKTDILIVALPPNATLSFFKAQTFNPENFELITDLSGLKMRLHQEDNPLFQNERYISHHPMTGYKSKGPTDFEKVVFNGKNNIIISKKWRPESETKLLQLCELLNLNAPTYLDALSHDKIITLNSHMPHLFASVMSHHEDLIQSHQMAGNSFKALMEYALMNPTLWTELFSTNQALLSSSIDELIKELSHFKSLLNDSKKLSHYLKEGSEILNKTKGH